METQTQHSPFPIDGAGRPTGWQPGDLTPAAISAEDEFLVKAETLSWSVVTAAPGLRERIAELRRLMPAEDGLDPIFDLTAAVARVAAVMADRQLDLAAARHPRRAFGTVVSTAAALAGIDLEVRS